MKAIVLADRLGRELLPMTQDTCVAMLSVAARPLIEYLLDTLLLIDIKQVFIVSSAFPEKIQRHLAGGEYWDMELHYALSQGEVAPSQILQRLPSGWSDGGCLLVRGDMLLDVDMKAFVEAAQQSDADCLLAYLNDQPAPFCLFFSGCVQPQWLDMLAWQHIYVNDEIPAESADFRVEKLYLQGTQAHLDSLQAFYKTSIAVLDGQFPGLVLPGWYVNEQVIVGRRSFFNPPPGVRMIAGDFCQIHAQAKFSGHVILNNLVSVDRHAHVENSVIMPATRVGEGMEVRNAIAKGNLLIQIDSGIITSIDDHLLLADMARNPLSIRFTDFVHQTAALLLLLLSLPLWLIALLLSWRINPKQPLQTQTLKTQPYWYNKISEAHSFKAWYWATDIPLFRYLPRLLSTVRGHLRLIGVSPLPLTDATFELPEKWLIVRRQAPTGLFGPLQLQSYECMPDEEALMTEIAYVHTRHPLRELVWLWRAFKTLFSRHLWQREACVPIDRLP